MSTDDALPRPNAWQTRRGVWGLISTEYERTEYEPAVRQSLNRTTAYLNCGTQD
jgi:hypothetical protein